MKEYGKPRKAYANRLLRGTKIECPCCIPWSTKRKRGTKVFKTRSREVGKREIREEIENYLLTSSEKVL